MWTSPAEVRAVRLISSTHQPRPIWCRFRHGWVTALANGAPAIRDCVCDGSHAARDAGRNCQSAGARELLVEKEIVVSAPNDSVADGSEDEILDRTGPIIPIKLGAHAKRQRAEAAAQQQQQTQPEPLPSQLPPREIAPLSMRCRHTTRWWIFHRPSATRWEPSSVRRFFLHCVAPHPRAGVNGCTAEVLESSIPVSPARRPSFGSSLPSCAAPGVVSTPWPCWAVTAASARR